jgi:NAD(P)-dependent dehydrogenase (short-subunit alcohol dehydrogenase family)
MSCCQMRILFSLSVGPRHVKRKKESSQESSSVLIARSKAKVLPKFSLRRPHVIRPIEPSSENREIIDINPPEYSRDDGLRKTRPEEEARTTNHTPFDPVSMLPSNHDLEGRIVLLANVKENHIHAVAQRFGSLGARVIILSSSYTLPAQDFQTGISGHRPALGPIASIVFSDCSKLGGAACAVSKLHSIIGKENGIDILVVGDEPSGVAGGSITSLENTSAIEQEEQWWQEFENRVRSPVSVIRAVLPEMQRRGRGTIITITDQESSWTENSLYSARTSSRAALSTFINDLQHTNGDDKGVHIFALDAASLIRHDSTGQGTLVDEHRQKVDSVAEKLVVLHTSEQHGLVK